MANKYFEKLRQGLKDCIDYENGDKTKATEHIQSVSDPLFDTADISRPRKDLDMT